MRPGLGLLEQSVAGNWSWRVGGETGVGRRVSLFILPSDVVMDVEHHVNHASDAISTRSKAK